MPEPDPGDGSIVNVSDSEAAADAIEAVEDGGKVIFNTTEPITQKLVINKPLTIIGNEAEFTGGIEVANAAVTIDNVVLTSQGTSNKDNTPIIKVTGEQPFTFINSTVRGTGRNPVLVKTGGEVVISGCTFSCENQNIYNVVEFSISADADITKAVVKNNIFNGPFKNNCINFYNVAEGAEIDIEDNVFTDIDVSSNCIRLSNPRNATATFNVKNNTYKFNGRSATQWTSFILLEDYAEVGEKQDFSKYTINIENLYRGSKKLTSVTSDSALDRVVLVYDDQDGILADGVNDPIVNI